MSGFKTGAIFVVCLYVAGVLQQALASRISILGASPDFLLLLAIAWALHLPRAWAAAAGFLAGAIHGALAGVSIAAYISSRAFGAFCASWSKDLRYELSFPVVGTIAFFATILSEVTWLLISPQPGIGAFLGATIGTAAYNGVLAWPVYALLRRLLFPSRR